MKSNQRPYVSLKFVRFFPHLSRRDSFYVYRRRNVNKTCARRGIQIGFAQTKEIDIDFENLVMRLAFYPIRFMRLC